ncbi:MAG: EAL domain-containing protein [Acidimicrobiia bacterium]|nr:EAL domain-containing protein [Acidimicrobiia bacterium]
MATKVDGQTRMKDWLRIPGPKRVWILTVMIAAAAGAIALSLRGLPPVGDRVSIDWWMLVFLVWAGELTVVHLRLRRDAHSFSMSEIPIIVGLFAVSPLALIGAQFVGTAIALGLNRRQPLVKLSFNLAQFSLVTAVQIVLFRGFAVFGDVYGATGWLGAIVALLVGSVVANLLINAAITLSGGDINQKELMEVAVLVALAVAMNAGLGLVVVAIMERAPDISWLAFIPPVVLFLSYRAYVGQRQERSRLEALYDATRELHSSPQLESALSAAAAHARAMLEAEYAEILLLPGTGTGTGLRTVAFQTGPTEVMHPTEIAPDHWSAIAKVQNLGAQLFSGSEADGFSVVSSSADAVMAPILGEGGEVAGAMLVVNRLGDTGKFEPGDVKLVATLAAQVGVSVENGRLEDSLAAVTELKEELRHQALHDSLTGLANRALFAEMVGEALAGDHTKKVAVLFLDLDDFKTVNDSLGHAAGDELLIVVAERLLQLCRGNDVVARLGGDEFAVLLTDIVNLASAVDVAARIIEDLAIPVYLDGKMVSTNTSVGIAYGLSGDAPSQLMRNADAAMYASKRAGKATYRVFDPSMHTEMVRRLELRAELKTAIDESQLFLMYQPLMDVTNERVIGFEALVRWQHPTAGVIAPLDFVPFAEESGLIVPLGRWVLNEACRQAGIWRRSEHTPETFAMHVNLSPRQLQNPAIIHDVAAAIESNQLDPGMLTLEITESVLMHSAASRLEELKALGVRLALDDFGTGYSSLSYLDRFPIDVLKIDRSFVERLRDGADGALLLRAVLKIAETLEMEAVAEGIETISQLGRLRDLGCGRGQGFLFAKPLVGREIDQLLDDPSLLSLDRRPIDTDADGDSNTESDPGTGPFLRVITN